MKKGLLISLYSPGREQYQAALEKSLEQDLVNFDILKLPAANNRDEITEAFASGYDYALENGYEYVGHIDDDDLVVPHGLTLLLKLLERKPKAAGFGGRQIGFRKEVPTMSVDPSAQILFDQHHHYFHGASVYRTKELYPTVNNWRSLKIRDQHRTLAKMLMDKGKTLGFTNSPISYYRLKDKNGNYYS